MGAVGSNNVIIYPAGSNGPAGSTDAKYDPSARLIERHIRYMVHEMNNERNCGWTKEHYRNVLINIRNDINKFLEGNN